MALSGTYTVTVQTPFGEKSGVLTLAENNGELTGTLSAEGRTMPLAAGTSSGNTFCCSVRLSVALSTMEMHMNGTVVGDDLSAKLTLPLGSTNLTGVRQV